MPTKSKRYRVLTGINYPPGKRVEACDCKPAKSTGDKPKTCEHVVTDIPEQSVKWLLSQGHIEEV